MPTGRPTEPSGMPTAIPTSGQTDPSTGKPASGATYPPTGMPTATGSAPTPVYGSHW